MFGKTVWSKPHAFTLSSLLLVLFVMTDLCAAQRRSKPKQPPVDYSHFSHTTHVRREKLGCDSCHTFPTKNWKDVRKADAAFQDVAEFPVHSSCLTCHREQFFFRERPAPVICSNCHVNVTPRDTARFLFPSLGDVLDPTRQTRDLVSDFAVNFPHDKHVDVVGSHNPALRPGFISVSWKQTAADAPKSCPVCHQLQNPQGSSDQEYLTTAPKNLGDNFWLKKGTFQTIPNSHTVCFTCHNKEAEIPPAPSDCNACHKLSGPRATMRNDFDSQLATMMTISSKTILNAWSQRFSSGTFRHESGDHPNISCVKCHNVPTMNTTETKTLVVSVRSCGGADGCHITATSDDGGILNYEVDQKKGSPSFVCTKCHISFGKEAVPESHLKAIQDMKKP